MSLGWKNCRSAHPRALVGTTIPTELYTTLSHCTEPPYTQCTSSLKLLPNQYFRAVNPTSVQDSVGSGGQNDESD